jgi:hypothetical protein
MSPTRLLIMLALGALLAALLGWQVQREQLVRACLDKGGAWDGGSCGPPRVRPILRRDLQRS